ncbi:hypothetical protein [Flavobacterium tructae]|uniref:Uncharacterized protein n=1 Tax=Flavobacterium tructae TaxID=1114873 RepID=A0A1S1JB68_9FLAO|nr:hypothetical protein [Flavobacterium tructae]OHT46814.1 hypothetical protein BHE19_04735 [Flavobacterium tructae]OXB21122.1 hypothetical protein B0A71_05915 [Flavobacterium tructae]
MKTILILFFISNFVFCQEVENIKKSDTVYIAFKKAKNTKKNIYTDNFREYIFSLDSKKNNQVEHLIFSKPDRKNSLTDKNNLVIDAKIENKSFLKKHSHNIIGVDFLKKFKEEYIVCELFSRSQIFYIVDFSESKKGNTKIYRVFLLNYCPISE